MNTFKSIFKFVSGTFRKVFPPRKPLEPIEVGTKAITRAVCIGLNSVDGGSIEYRTWIGFLRHPETDAARFTNLWIKHGIPTTTLLTAEATIENVGRALRTACTGMGPGSTLIVTISCHGMDDGLRQYMCLYDGKLKDTIIHKWLKMLGDIRVLWICDSCAAAGMYRTVPGPVISSNAARGVECELILIAGCDRDKSSYENLFGGLLTDSLLNTGPGELSPDAWFDEMYDLIDLKLQRPKLIQYGPVSDDFLHGPVLRDLPDITLTRM
jgi:hypothetical protein